MILVFGKTGQVATELQRVSGVMALGREEVDLSDPAACAAAVREHAPKAVINAAAYTTVDKAEDEEHLATVINGDAPCDGQSLRRARIPWFISQRIMFLTDEAIH